MIQTTELALQGKSFHPVLAFLLAPLVPGCVMLSLLFSLLVLNAHPFRFFEAVPLSKIGDFCFFVFYVSALVAYPPALLAGVPAHFLFRYMKWNGLPVYLSFGFSLGAVYSIFFKASLALIMTARVVPPSMDEGLILPCAFFGGLVAVIFWLMVRPDLSLDWSCSR